jgi:hypothetical protein
MPQRTGVTNFPEDFSGEKAIAHAANVARAAKHAGRISIR